MSTIKRNKQRGYELEAEIVEDAEAKGLDAERAWGSNGRALGEHATVDARVAGCRIQAKRVKTLAKKYTLNEHQDAIVFRADRGKKYALIRFDDLLDIIVEKGGW